jgi:5-methylcytosine-specific restriction endonuclease McrA
MGKVFKQSFGWVEDIPNRVRQAVYARAKGHCEDCNEDTSLFLHHVTYLAGTIFGRERPTDLLALCQDCHEARHTDHEGRFHGDPEEIEPIL